MRRSLLLVLLVLLGAMLLGSGQCVVGGGSSGGSSSHYDLNLNGGAGIDDDGGQGGVLAILTDGTQGIQLKKNDKAKFNVNLPSTDFSAAVDLGPNPLIVDQDLTINAYTSRGAAIADGVLDGGYFILFGDYTVYQLDTAGPPDDVVTGLRVEKNVTLTLGLNFDYMKGTNMDTAAIDFFEPEGDTWGDVEILGTVIAKSRNTGFLIPGSLDMEPAIIDRPDYNSHGNPVTARDSGNLVIAAQQVFVRKDGLVDARGVDGTENQNGGDGGSVFLYGDDGAFVDGQMLSTGGDGAGSGHGGNGDDAFILSEGAAFHSGDQTVDASGGNGRTGGQGGGVGMGALSFVFNIGRLVSNGGIGNNGHGGDGGEIDLFACESGIYNSGDLIANGGDATDGDAGWSGFIELNRSCGFGFLSISPTNGPRVGYPGQIINIGSITANGGNADNGDGGSVTGMRWDNFGGDVISNAPITMNGGVGTGSSSYGGDAAFYCYTGENITTTGGCSHHGFWIYNYPAYSHFSEGIIQTGDVLISNDINMNGGIGDKDGGYGGLLAIHAVSASNFFIRTAHIPYTYYQPANFGVSLVRFDSINVNGGPGYDDGGDGGEVYFYTAPARENHYQYQATGTISNTIDINGRGGPATDDDSGNGGYLYAYAKGLANQSNVCNWNADIDLSGADGPSEAGYGGYAGLWCPEGVNFSGHVDLSGGNGTDGNSWGGYGGVMYVGTQGEAKISGQILLNGGRSDGAGHQGGQAGWLDVDGGLVKCSMDGNASGGDALGTAQGGDGGGVELFSDQTPGSVLSGSWNVGGGDGTPDGDNGAIWIDGVEVTPTDL